MSVSWNGAIEDVAFGGLEATGSINFCLGNLES